MSRKFNIRTLDKAALVMERVGEIKSPERLQSGEIKSPEKAPVRRQLLVGSDVTVQTLNNKIKKHIHVPQCIDGHSADMRSKKEQNGRAGCGDGCWWCKITTKA